MPDLGDKGATQRKADFVIAGAQKGGTTALAAYLHAHPEVCMARGEGHFSTDPTISGNRR